jgi:hypothetical protein
MQQESSGGFPTVLVAELDGVSPALANDLRNAGYNVLEAHDWTSAVSFIKTHSRPIHVLLTNVDRDAVDAAEIGKFRRDLHVLFISHSPPNRGNDDLDPASALMAVKELLRSHATAGSTSDNNRVDNLSSIKCGT